jgi:hypothetical protein
LRARRPTLASQGWTILGLGGALAHLVLLSSIALFNDGGLDPQWTERLPWLTLVAIPAGFAAVGLRNPSALATAAITSVPLSLISLAGATLPLILFALCYLAGYLTSASIEEA